MANVWMQSHINGTFHGDRCAVSGLSEKDAKKVVESLAEEFKDMGIPIDVWVD